MNNQPEALVSVAPADDVRQGRGQPRIGPYLGRRFVQVLMTLLVLSVVTFAATNAVPSDPARIALGHFATTQQVRLFDQQQGLNKPVTTRYVDWLGHTLTGDWGDSTLTSLPVAGMVFPRLARSLVLALIATLLAVPIAYLAGVYSGQRSGRRSDVGISAVALLINSTPDFVIALLLLFLLAAALHVLPVESSAAASSFSFATVKAYVLPTLAVTLLLIPYILRMVRVNVSEVLAQPFVRSLMLRGIPRRRTVWRHVVPNASLPVINVVALSTAELIGGVVVVETVFGFPGIGQLFLNSVSGGDIPVVQVIAMIIGLGYVLLNFAADAVVALLNPQARVR